MGRTKYSDQKRKEIVISFIHVTRQIIDTEGIEGVSIRKIAQKTGFKSGNLYRYFKDVDELITLTAFSYLKNYYLSMTKEYLENLTSDNLYINVWQSFCQYIFESPEVFCYLFFHPHSIPLKETIDYYFSLFPEQLDLSSGPYWEMLHENTLQSRNMKLLTPMVEEQIITEKRAALINDLSIGYCRQLLEEMCEGNNIHTAKQQTDRFMEASNFLLFNK